MPNEDILTTTGIPEGDSAGEFIVNEIVDRVSRTRRVTRAKVAAQLAAEGPIADRINASATGIVVNGLNKLNAITAPDLNAKAEIRGSGNAAVDGVYGKAAPAGQAGWTRLADLDSVSSSAIAENAAAIAEVDQRSLTKLDPAAGHGTVVAGVLKLVCTGGKAGTRSAMSRDYLVPMPAITNPGPSVTLSIDGDEKPYCPPVGDAWPVGGVQVGGRARVTGETDKYRHHDGYGAFITEDERGVMRRAATYDVGDSAVVQNESEVTIYTFFSKDIPTGIMNPLAKFQGIISGYITETNSKAKAKIQILRPDGGELTGKVELRTAAPIAEIRARGVPVGLIQFVPRPGKDGAPDLFLMTGGATVGGDGTFDETTVAAIRSALTADDAEDPLVLSSELAAIATGQEARFAAMDDAAQRARGAVGAAFEALNTGFIGESGFAGTLLIGDAETASGALVPDAWLGQDAIGAYVLVDGGTAGGSLSQTVATARVMLFRDGRNYECVWEIQRSADGDSSDARAVKLGVQWLTGDKLAIADGGQLLVFNDAPTVADGVITIRKTFAYAAGADHQIPAAAKGARAYVEAFGSTPQTKIRFLGFRDVTNQQAVDVSGKVDKASMQATIKTGCARLISGIRAALTLSGRNNRLLMIWDTAARPYQYVAGAFESIISRSEVAAVAQTAAQAAATSAAANAKDSRIRSGRVAHVIGGVRTRLFVCDPVTNRVSFAQSIDGKLYELNAAGQLVRTGGGVRAPDVAVTWNAQTFHKALTSSASLSGTVYMILVTGQSWARGLVSAAISTAAAHPGKALMFPGGPIVTLTSDVSSLVDLRESGTQETPCSGMADVIMTRLQASLGFKPVIIFADACLPGTPLQGDADGTGTTFDANDGLMQGSVQYRANIRAVQAANALVTAAGGRLVVLGMTIHHGEADLYISTLSSVYERGCDNLLSDYTADVRAITGQTQPLRGYTYQASRGAGSVNFPAVTAPIIIEQFTRQQRNSAWRCVGPAYFAPDDGSGGHTNASGYRKVARMFGDSIAEDLFGKWAEPLYVMERRWISTTKVALRLSKPVAIENDDSKITVSTLGPGKGLTFTDSWNVNGRPTSSVSISAIAVATWDPSAIEVTLSGAPTGLRPRIVSATLVQGGNGNVTGARTGIRSADPYDTDPLDGAQAWHWLCAQDVQL